MDPPLSHPTARHVPAVPLPVLGSPTETETAEWKPREAGVTHFMKRARKRRHTVAPGIYRERNFYYATKRLGSHVTEESGRSRKFDLATSIATIKAWQARAEAELLEELPIVPCEGSLVADVPKFLDTVPAKQRDDFRRLMAHWIDPETCELGELHRSEITREHILTQRSAWLDSGAAISTVNHRVRALRKFYDALDGPAVPHPTDRIKKLREPKPEPRGIPMEAVAIILAAIPDRGRAARGGKRGHTSHTKIRLALMAYTGMPHAQLERLTYRHVDLLGCFDAQGVAQLGGRVYLTPRRKGQGNESGTWVGPLFPQAVTAFVAFGAAGLWGQKFSRSSMGKAWKGAIRRVTNKLAAVAARSGDRTALDAWTRLIPPNCHPYDVRHSFGTFAYETTGDLRAVAELMQHANLETTKRYTLGAVSGRVAAAMAKMHEALRGATTPPPPPAKKRGRGALTLVQTGS